MHTYNKLVTTAYLNHKKTYIKRRQGSTDHTDVVISLKLLREGGLVTGWKTWATCFQGNLEAGLKQKCWCHVSACWNIDVLVHKSFDKCKIPYCDLVYSNATPSVIGLYCGKTSSFIVKHGDEIRMKFKQQIHRQYSILHFFQTDWILL